MKTFNITLSLEGTYHEGNYLDLDNFRFVEPIDLDEIETGLSLWLLMYEKSNVEVEMIHIDESTEQNSKEVGDNDDYALGTTG